MAVKGAVYDTVIFHLLLLISKVSCYLDHLSTNHHAVKYPYWSVISPHLLLKSAGDSLIKQTFFLQEE